MTTTATTPLTIVLLVLPVVLAMPPGERRMFTTHALVPRANNNSTGNGTNTDNNQNSNVGIQIWVPLVAIAALIIVLMVISFVRKRKLAATIRALRENGSSTTTTANRTAPTARRPRRQRRTPSQISTRSLPAYMVEPGESELVLVRGEDANEDRMRPVAEDNERHEEEDITDQQTPLLETPPTRLEPPAEPAARRSHSFDTVRMGSDASHDALLHHTLSREELRQLGDAPPYEPPHEMVEIGPGASLARPASTVVSSPQQETAAVGNAGAPSDAASMNGTSVPSQETQGRKSGFRKMMARIVRPTSSSGGAGSSSTQARRSTVVSPSEAPAVQESTPQAPAATPEPEVVRTHTRQGSNTTVASTFSRVRSRQPEHTRTRSQSNATHLRSQSSFSTLARFSRSTLSLNQVQAGSSTTNLPATNSNFSTTSISPPLAHTLIRTSFAYPSGGPTQEQIRFLSSRETLGRYGVPYGEAAMAQSRELLLTQLEPPPPFESPATETGSNAASNGDGEENQANEASTANNETSLSSHSHQRSQSDPHAHPSTPSSPHHSRPPTDSSVQTVTVRPMLQPLSSAGSIETFQTAQELPGTPTSVKTTGRSEDAADLTLDMSVVSHADTTLVDSPEAGASTPTATPKKSPLQRKGSSSSSAEQQSAIIPEIQVAPASPHP